MELAAIGEFWRDNGENVTWDALKSYTQYAHTYYYPLLYQFLHYKTYEDLVPEYLDVIKSAPCEGPIYRPNCTENENNIGTEMWRSKNRWRDAIGAMNGVREGGEMPGIDFKLFYNLFKINLPALTINHSSNQ